jgi:hypothetical protein
MAPALLLLTAVFTSTLVLKLDSVRHTCPGNTESAAYVRIAAITASMVPASLAKDTAAALLSIRRLGLLHARPCKSPLSGCLRIAVTTAPTSVAQSTSAERVPAHRSNSNGSNFRGAVDSLERLRVRCRHRAGRCSGRSTLTKPMGCMARSAVAPQPSRERSATRGVRPEEGGN